MKNWVKNSLVIVAGFAAGYATIYLFSNSGSGQSGDFQSNADGSPVEIDWSLLRELDVDSGKAPDKLKKLNGSFIKVPGFIVPLEDNSQAVTEFLLVPSPTACVHTPPPPPNQMIHVKMAGGKIAKMAYGPVWLTGRLRIDEHMGPFGKSAFQIVGDATVPYSSK